MTHHGLDMLLTILKNLLIFLVLAISITNALYGLANLLREFRLIWKSGSGGLTYSALLRYCFYVGSSLAALVTIQHFGMMGLR